MPRAADGGGSFESSRSRSASPGRAASSAARPARCGAAGPGGAWAGLVLLLTALPASAAVASPDLLELLERGQEEVFGRAAPAVVLITREGGSGSGFFVARDGLVLTNGHVVGAAIRVRVALSDGRILDGAVVERAPEGVDLALVRVPVADAPVLPLGGSGSLRVGSWAASVGHGGGAAWTFTAGMISNLLPLGGRSFIQVQMPLRPGASGGPLIDRRGRAVGVITAGTREVEGISFAIPAETAVAALGLLTGSAARAEGPTPVRGAERPLVRREEWPPAAAVPALRGEGAPPRQSPRARPPPGPRLRAGFPDLEAREAPGS